MANKLKNYLRTARRRAGLTQGELAFLLGGDSGSKVSRYERNLRQPGLETILAYEAIFGSPVRELLAGDYQSIRNECLERIETLVQRLTAMPQNKRTAFKLKMLRSFLDRERYE